MKRRVISCGNDRGLLRTRVWVLASAGFQVEEVVGLKGLLDRQFASDLGLVVLCHTLSEQEQQAAVQYLEHARPGTPTLSLRSSKKRPTPAGTAQLDPLNGPRALIELSQRLAAGSRN